jgi:hypothetical protein
MTHTVIIAQYGSVRAKNLIFRRLGFVPQSNLHKTTQDKVRLRGLTENEGF